MSGHAHTQECRVTAVHKLPAIPPSPHASTMTQDFLNYCSCVYFPFAAVSFCFFFLGDRTPGQQTAGEINEMTTRQAGSVVMQGLGLCCSRHTTLPLQWPRRMSHRDFWSATDLRKRAKGEAEKTYHTRDPAMSGVKVPGENAPSET